MGFENDATRGVNTHYGVRTTDGKWGGQLNSDGLTKKAVWKFDYNDLPAGGSTSNMEQVIPANSTIVSAVMYIDTAFTSTSTTSDLLVGLETAAGAAIDADGLVAAAEATQTAIAVLNGSVTGAGALVGTTIGTTAGELVVAPSADDLLTGSARVVVEYVVAV
jgi:hypothetical protein